MLLRQFWQQISSFRQSRKKLNMLNLFRLRQKAEILQYSFDIGLVAVCGNKVECWFDNVAGVDGALVISITRRFRDSLLPRHSVARTAGSLRFTLWKPVRAISFRKRIDNGKFGDISELQTHEPTVTKFVTGDYTLAMSLRVPKFKAIPRRWRHPGKWIRYYSYVIFITNGPVLFCSLASVVYRRL